MKTQCSEGDADSVLAADQPHTATPDCRLASGMTLCLKADTFGFYKECKHKAKAASHSALVPHVLRSS